MISTLIEKIAHFLFAIFVPLQYYLLFVGVIMAMDTLLRIIVLYRVNNLKGEWSNIVSGLKMKMLIYTPIALSVFWLDSLVLNELTKQFVSIEMLSTKLACVLLVFEELKSIDKNFGSLTGKTFVERFNSATTTFKAVKGKLKDSAE